jgi:hypothetical protein
MLKGRLDNMYGLVECPDIVLASVQNSAGIDIHQVLADAHEWGLITPASMEAGTIEVSDDGTTWVGWQMQVGITMTDVPYPAASKGGSFTVVPSAKYMRIHATAGATAATRTIKMWKRIVTT